MLRPDLTALAARLPRQPLTRFAPSPTYWLHLGHLVNAIYVWGLAHALGGRVLLRIEDHDRTRCRPEYERGILDDLDWLGLQPDDIGDGLNIPFRGKFSPSPIERRVAFLRQSDRTDTYDAARQRLAASAGVYACTCSRRDIAAASAGAGTEERYPGTCRSLARPGGPGAGLRVLLPPGIERFDDGLVGWQVQEPAAQCGDLLIRDRHRCWTYQFAVTVDDCAQGIDLVIRGHDLLDSTGRQIALARMLGRPEPPVFLHHPLVVQPDGAKISKSNRDTGIRDLRAAGVTAPEVLGRAAHACGLTSRPRPITADDLPALFAP